MANTSTIGNLSTNPSSGSATATPTQSLSSDSTTAFGRQMSNLTGAQGSNTLQAGANQYASGIQSAAPALDYLTKLVSGNRTDLEQATQPETDQIQSQFDQIRQLISTGPRGGGTASAMVKAPSEEVKAIADVRSGAQKGAAGALGGLATSLAGLGISQESIGSMLEQLSANNLTTIRGQDVQSEAATKAMWGDIGKGVGSLVGGAMAGGVFGGK